MLSVTTQVWDNC